MMHGIYSPFIVPVAAFAMVLGIVIVANISNYHTLRLKSEEHMAAIAKGIPLPPDPDTELVATASRTAYVDRPQNARGLRTGGIVLMSVGVGLGLFGFFLAWIVQEHDVLVVAAAGLIPLVIGIGLLADYGLRIRGVAQKQD